jgi:hypothetical protein
MTGVYCKILLLSVAHLEILILQALDVAAKPASRHGMRETEFDRANSRRTTREKGAIS